MRHDVGARTLRTMLQGILEQIAHGGHSADLFTLEATADGAHAFAARVKGVEFVRDLDDLVEPHGCRIVYDDGFPAGETGLVLGDLLIVQRLRNPPRRVLGGAHEFGHWLDQKHRINGTHSDVWLLTLMLAWPIGAIRRGEGPLLGIPAELIVMRAGMPSVRRLLARQGRLDDFV